MILISSVSDLSRCKVEGEDSDGIRVLIRDNQELPAVIKLEMTRCLPSRMEEADLSERAPRRLSFDTAALFHAEDRDGLVPSIRDNNVAP
mmetsp:Transcript_26254/g.54841  ORF Transcript_26254/g.54841 Transcript_26254/m.54841 type:complete len:90 (-) Transcript_26254:1063-1332(-)